MTIRSYGGAIGRRGPEPAVYALPLEPGKHHRLPWPILIRGVAYASVLLVAVWLLATLPGTGVLLAQLAFIPKYVAAPIALALLLTQTRVDDRFVHVALVDAWWWLRAPRRTSAGERIG